MELVVAPVEELRVRLRSAFEEAVDRPIACALTGGSTALIFLGALRHARVDWTGIRLFWADERAVPYDHPVSNFGVARRVLLDPLRQDRAGRGPRALPMPVDHASLSDAAAEYDNLLAHELGGAPLDLAIIGVDEDGHVCSLFPGHRALLEDRARVAAVEDAPKPPARRLTLTLRFVLESRLLWIVAIGPRKRPALQAAIARTGHATPIDLVLQRRNVTVFTDQSVHM
jgi:6-phosphogluconolactonase